MLERHREPGSSLVVSQIDANTVVLGILFLFLIWDWLERVLLIYLGASPSYF